MNTSNTGSIGLTDIHSGLTSAYAAAHLGKRRGRTSGNLKIAFEVLLNQVSSIFFILLVASAALSWYLGNIVDSYIFIGITLANTILGFIQEFKASQAGRKLEQMVEHKGSVIRDGHLMKVSSDELVTGDIMLVASGDVLIADLLVRESADAYVDDSVRTGESIPVAAEEGSCVYAGAGLASGRIIGQVVAAGSENSLIAYSAKLAGVKKNNSFAKFISEISSYVLFITLFCMATIGIVSVYITGKYSVTDFILFSISMLIGVVPESLALIITLMLTREALSLAKSQVLVKRLSALQLLGSIKYLLVDKTGTLTENKIKVARREDMDGGLDEAMGKIAYAEYERTPMDTAFDSALSAQVPPPKALDMQPIVTPFKNAVGYAVYEFKDSHVIRGQCHAVLAQTDLSPERKAEIDEMCASFESNGLRAIALATQSAGATTYAFNGLVAFEDPLKADAHSSYLAAEGLGISVKVLTGDSKRVAEYVVKQLDPKLDERHVCSLDETEISKLSAEEIESDKVYARCLPENKLDLIDRHVRNGAVGFLGEGINDALALKRADVGMVVNNASDVARQSADILLMEKSLNPVIKAIQMSRRAYAHISMYILCTLTGNIGTLFSLTGVALFWKDLPMLPVQILLNNLLTDAPLILLLTDKLSKDEYGRPVDHSPARMFRIIVIFGLISSAFDIVYFLMFYQYPLEALRTGWLVSSVLAELILVLSLRTKLAAWRGRAISRPLLVGLVACAAVAISLPFIPAVGALFHLVPLGLYQLSVIIGLVVAYFLVNELAKKSKIVALES